MPEPRRFDTILSVNQLSLSLMVDYRTAYKRFISSAKKKMHGIDSKRKLYEVQSDEKLEVHHINPKQLGGNNKLKNLVLLSHDDHVYAHLLLNLALFQRHSHAELLNLYYTDVPKGILKMLKARKNIFRGLKIDMFISGKKHAPTTMSIVEAAKIFCILGRKNYTNELLLDTEVSKVMRLALFSGSKFGYKLKFHL